MTKLPSREVAVLDPCDPAPFHGVLIGDDLWMDVYQRLQECEK